MDTSSLGAEALEKLKATFAPERWAKIERQASQRGGLDAEGLQGLCATLIATSHVRHSDNEKAVLYSAANRLLIMVGSALQPNDVERFEAALGRAAAPPVADAPMATAKPKRGGKHEPAPAPSQSS
jgi:hypothetical protein